MFTCGIIRKSEHGEDGLSMPVDSLQNEHNSACVSASVKMVDVMGFIDMQFLSKGKFPTVQEYSYETYCSEMKVGLALN